MPLTQEMINDTMRPLGGCGKWKPIETAPKDGTVFLAWSHKGAARCCWGEVDWEDYPRGKVYRWWLGVDDAFYVEEPGDEPTHWLEIPLPPTKPT